MEKHPVTRVTLTVYCRTEDVDTVQDELEDAFANSAAELWRPHGIRRDDGEPAQAQAARAHFAAVDAELDETPNPQGA